MLEELLSLRAFAEAHEQWEANVILNGDWSKGNVMLTDELQDEFIEVQRLRCVALESSKTTKTLKMNELTDGSGKAQVL